MKLKDFILGIYVGGLAMLLGASLALSGCVTITKEGIVKAAKDTYKMYETGEEAYKLLADEYNKITEEG